MEYLFRGKKAKSDDWVEGSLIVTTDNINPSYWIIVTSKTNGAVLVLGEKVRVTEESIEQYTGLTELDGNKLFKGRDS